MFDRVTTGAAFTPESGMVFTNDLGHPLAAQVKLRRNSAKRSAGYA